MATAINKCVINIGNDSSKSNNIAEVLSGVNYPCPLIWGNKSQIQDWQAQVTFTYLYHLRYFLNNFVHSTHRKQYKKLILLFVLLIKTINYIRIINTTNDCKQRNVTLSKNSISVYITETTQNQTLHNSTLIRIANFI